MKVCIRRIKRAWAYCDTDATHGMTPFELTLETNDSAVLKVWLCQRCLANIPGQFQSAADDEYRREMSRRLKEAEEVKGDGTDKK